MDNRGNQSLQLVDSASSKNTDGHRVPECCHGHACTSIGTVSGNELEYTVPDKITLLVDGKRFVVSPNLFTKYPNTMLGR